MKPLAAFAASLLALLFSTQASAAPADLTIINKTNTRIACATVHLVDGRWETHHWTVIDNGRSADFGEVHFAHCEEVGGQGPMWSGDESNMFCVSSGHNYVNPIYDSDSSENCDAIDGIMAEFKQIPGSSYTWTLRP